MKIPYIKRGEIIPIGLSRYDDGHRLRVPVFAWLRRGYLISHDAMAHGLWRFEICLRTELSGFAIHWGWVFVRGEIAPPRMA